WTPAGCFAAVTINAVATDPAPFTRTRTADFDEDRGERAVAAVGDGCGRRGASFLLPLPRVGRLALGWLTGRRRLLARRGDTDRSAAAPGTRAGIGPPGRGGAVRRVPRPRQRGDDRRVDRPFLRALRRVRRLPLQGRLAEGVPLVRR